MKTFGLTGGIGMGKSACTQLLRARGLPVMDTDEIARQIVEPGQPALAEVRAAFGSQVIGDDGQLRRDVLAQIVFTNPAARQQLEAILHPRIRETWKTQLVTWRQEKQSHAFVVIPLLLETRAEKEFDHILCIACSAITQRERLRARGWSDEQARQRLAAQMSIEEKMLRSHYVIWSEGSLAIHQEQLARILS